MLARARAVPLRRQQQRRARAVQAAVGADQHSARALAGSGRRRGAPVVARTAARASEPQRVRGKDRGTHSAQPAACEASRQRRPVGAAGASGSSGLSFAAKSRSHGSSGPRIASKSSSGASVSAQAHSMRRGELRKAAATNERVFRLCASNGCRRPWARERCDATREWYDAARGGAERRHGAARRGESHERWRERAAPHRLSYAPGACGGPPRSTATPVVRGPWAEGLRLRGLPQKRRYSGCPAGRTLPRRVDRPAA